MLSTVSKRRTRLSLVLVGNGLMRISSGASGTLVGLYLANLANRGAAVNAAFVGTLGAVSFGAELLGALPMGMASDAVAPRSLMCGGALLGGIATQLFGLTARSGIFFLSRSLEGMGAAATTPSLLAHLTDVTDRNRVLRLRVMSYFELSLLAGLALGGLTGGQFWRVFAVRGFTAVAALYGLAAALLFFGAVGGPSQGSQQVMAGFRRALREPSLRRLAPVWLCVNTIVGLWLGPTFTFLLTHRRQTHQFLDGVLADHPDRVGWILLGYAIIFGTGVSAWSVVLPRVGEQRALHVALMAMLVVCICLFLLNHSAEHQNLIRWMLATVSVLCVLVESGFTPAALSLLAGAIGAQAGRGAAMGIYSVLLSIGAIAGSFLAGVFGQVFAVDGLIYSTLAMAVIALLFVPWIKTGVFVKGSHVRATV